MWITGRKPDFAGTENMLSILCALHPVFNKLTLSLNVMLYIGKLGYPVFDVAYCFNQKYLPVLPLRKIVQNRTGFLRSAFSENKLSPITLI